VRVVFGFPPEDGAERDRALKPLTRRLVAMALTVLAIALKLARERLGQELRGFEPAVADSPS
jgi:hypothetical protein